MFIRFQKLCPFVKVMQPLNEMFSNVKEINEKERKTQESRDRVKRKPTQDKNRNRSRKKKKLPSLPSPPHSNSPSLLFPTSSLPINGCAAQFFSKILIINIKKKKKRNISAQDFCRHCAGFRSIIFLLFFFWQGKRENPRRNYIPS